MTAFKITSDWHTHTRYSDGRGTVDDNVRAAAEKGLSEIAITDHGPRGIFIGVKDAATFLQIKEDIQRVREKYPVKVLLGAEANVTGLAGEIDIPPEIAGEMDILLVGLHPQAMAESWQENFGWMLPNFLGRISDSMRESMRAANTEALVRAMYRHPVDVVTHPDLMMAVDLDEIARASADTGCAMEINVGHGYNKDGVIKSALRRGAQLVVNSDAHYPATVGELDKGIELLARWNVPVEQVVNVLPLPEGSGVGDEHRGDKRNAFTFRGSPAVP